MLRGRCLALFLILSLLVNAFCYPSVQFRRSTTLDTKESKETNQDNTAAGSSPAAVTSDDDDFDDDDFDDEFSKTSTSSGGGSSFLSLLNIANAVLPSLSGGNNVTKNNELVRKLIKDVIQKYKTRVIHKRKDVEDNVIEIDYVSELTPPFFQRQESEETAENNSQVSKSNSKSSEDDQGGEESIEESADNNGSNSKEEPTSNASKSSSDSKNDDDSNDSDYDEPDGDGQGGGILGVLAGLSGDGESDLGSLLAAIGGIVANLSAGGVDVNAIIATGFGLLVGLLSDEGTNPGEVIASYLVTSLDSITGGGAENNGGFIGKFVTSLLKGVSAVDDGSASSEENGNGGIKMADSAGFFASLLTGLLGDMSKHSSSSSWR